MKIMSDTTTKKTRAKKYKTHKARMNIYTRMFQKDFIQKEAKKKKISASFLVMSILEKTYPQLNRENDLTHLRK